MSKVQLSEVRKALTALEIRIHFACISGEDRSRFEPPVFIQALESVAPKSGICRKLLEFVRAPDDIVRAPLAPVLVQEFETLVGKWLK